MFQLLLLRGSLICNVGGFFLLLFFCFLNMLSIFADQVPVECILYVLDGMFCFCFFCLIIQQIQPLHTLLFHQMPKHLILLV